MGPVDAWAPQLFRWLGLGTAVVAAALYLRLFARDAMGEVRLRRGFLWVSVAAMSVTLIWRAVELGTVPLLTPGEALFFYGWLVFLVYLTLMRSPTQALVGALLVPFGAICVLLGAVATTDAAAVLPIFQSPLFAVHTLAAFLGYSALSVACCAGILYLVLYDHVVHKKMNGLFRRLPPLEDLDRLGFRTVLLGFLLLTVAIVVGAVWARSEWGVNWVVEPKTVWALVSWGVYAVYLIVRGTRGWRGKRAAWLATAGFALSIAGFLGTNYWLASGRHVF
jgi:cytochrome c-type biogenesis protein CcsB